MTPTSLYIHIPFCLSKCAYCDFNSIVAPEELRERYHRALLREFARTGAFYHQRRIETIYFGGGTPTVTPTSKLCELLGRIRQNFEVAPDAEITIEANPGTVTTDSLATLREIGFNRLSLGVQSLDDHELRQLGRCHSAAQTREAISAARAAGFDNLSVDLINCLPGQTLEQWLQTLVGILEYYPEHLSCYGLSIEPGTELGRQAERGILPPSEEGVAVEIYEATHELLTEEGYEHYEISNYARLERGPHPVSRRCRHNLNYWRNGEYVAIGAGATSHLNGYRLKTEPDPEKWLGRVLAGMPPGLVQKEALTDRQQALEVLMLALRTSDGLDLVEFCRQFALDIERYEVRLKALVEADLATWDGRRLTLTPEQGFLLHSEIVGMFM